MTTKETIFKHKEHYLAFRAAWAKSVNDKDVKITAAHHMVYNILRGKDFDTGFSPVIRTTKLQNGFYINQGVYQASREVNWESLLKVFDGTATSEMVHAAKMPECKPMWSNYGPYMKVAQHIIESNFDCKPHSFEDIQMILEYVQKEHK